MVKLYERPDSPYWYAELQFGTETRRVSTGVPRGTATKRKAREAAAEKQRELEQDATRRLSVSFSQVWAIYFARAPQLLNLKASTLRQYEYKVAIIVHTLSNPLLSEITPQMLRDYIRLRRPQTSDIQIRQELIVISSVIEFAIDQDMEGAPEVNPVQLVRKKGLAKAVKKPRWLQLEQVREILRVAPDRFWKPFLIVLLETGMRKEEVLGLEWRELDLEGGFIHLTPEREKNKKGRVIPLTDTALNTIRALPRSPKSPHVFVSHKTGERYFYPYSGWSKIRNAAGVPNARIHDLRHTFASLARQSGMSKEDRMDIVGHHDDGTHGGYAKVSLQSLRETVQKHSPLTLLAQERK